MKFGAAELHGLWGPAADLHSARAASREPARVPVAICVPGLLLIILALNLAASRHKPKQKNEKRKTKTKKHKKNAFSFSLFLF
jgi:hypothetical protein